MKKQLNTGNQSAVSMILRFGFFSFLLFTLLSNRVIAQQNVKPATAVVSYLGMVDSQPLFQVDFNATAEASYTLTIRDDEGSILYMEKFRSKSFSKKFRLERGDREHVQLNFTITAGKKRHTQFFDINTNFKVHQDVLVTKL